MTSEEFKEGFTLIISTHTPSVPLTCLQFLLTRPLRDVTTSITGYYDIPFISTHTPLTGRDQLHDVSDDEFDISTHTPLTGRDKWRGELKNQESISTHTPLTGRDCLQTC